MKPMLSVPALLVLAGLIFTGCSQPASVQAPTNVPTAAGRSEPTKVVAESTKPPLQDASQGKKADWPAKGQSVTLIVPFPAGGSIDLGARLLVPTLEKELGVSIQIANKPGASTQVGMTELVRSKPDGYTLGYVSLPATIIAYLDPERKAIFSRKDFQPLALHVFGPTSVGVKADSPYKTMKELIEAAKANPEKIKAGDTGVMTVRHLAVLQTEKVTGTKFAAVHFDGGAPATTALLGGHVDAGFQDVSEFLPHFKSGAVRVLGVMDKDESKYFPGVKTMEAQGYKLYSVNAAGIAAPAGTPKDVADLLVAALKKAMNSDEHKKKMEESALTLHYMDQAGFGSFWADLEIETRSLMELAKGK